MYIEVAVKYKNEEGKKVSERYVVNASSFGNAENSIMSDLVCSNMDDFKIVSETKSPYSEVLYYDNSSLNLFFKVKVKMVCYDEESNKEKKFVLNYLVSASTIEEVDSTISRHISDSMNDYTITNIQQTNIVEVLRDEENL